MNNSTFKNISLVGQGSTTVTLPVGAYSVEGLIYTEAPGDPTRTYAIDGFSIPSIDVTDQDVTRSVDGTKATDFTVKVTGEKRPLENASWMTLVSRSDGSRRSQQHPRRSRSHQRFRLEDRRRAHRAAHHR